MTKEELNILSESVRELQEGQAAAAKKAGEAKAMLEKAIASQKEIKNENPKLLRNLELKLQDVNNGKL